MSAQMPLITPFRVKGGAKADKLWEMLREIGVHKCDEHEEPRIEFVTNERAQTYPGAHVIYLAVEDERNDALSVVSLKGWDGPIFVDAVGGARESEIRGLQRRLIGNYDDR